MKLNGFILVSFLFLYTACNKENNDTSEANLLINDYPQTWVLFKMTGSFEGSEYKGDAMEWQENYVFYSNLTFKKTRIKEGKTIVASGTYIMKQDQEEQAILLTYNQSNEIIGSCLPNKESLYYDANQGVLLSNWWACDGPGLFYKKAE